MEDANNKKPHSLSKHQKGLFVHTCHMYCQIITTRTESTVRGMKILTFYFYTVSTNQFLQHA